MSGRVDALFSRHYAVWGEQLHGVEAAWQVAQVERARSGGDRSRFAAYHMAHGIERGEGGSQQSRL